MKGPFCFIVNPKAGGGRTGRLWPYFEERLRKARVAFTVVMALSPEEALRASARLDEEWIPVAVGGDGTLQAVVEGLAPGRTVGHLPTGTGNDFARSVGISRSPAKALHQLLTGKPRPIDLPAANGRPFLGAAGVAFGGLTALLGWPSGWPGGRRSLFALLASLLGSRQRSARIAITVDGMTQEGKAAIVAVANCRFFGGLDVCPLAHPDDGLLDLCVAEELKPAEAVAALSRLHRGTHVRHPKVHYTKAHTVLIEGPPGAKLFADGKPLTGLPAAIGLEQQALRVVVPCEAWNPSKVTSILRGRPGSLDSGAER